jgi:hypothetical protein
MKKLLILALAIALPAIAAAQDGAKTLASTINVYVFPAEGQDASQQSKDEAECYSWAVNNTGNDPFDLADQQEAHAQLSEAEMQAAQSTGQGAGAGGAVRGAAAGALVGEIANDDASNGAAWGAAAGMVRGRRQGRQAQDQATQQAAAQADQRESTNAEDLDNFKKAFGVCLEAKEYMVK